MKVPFDWLKEFVDIKADAKKVAEKLSLSGTEIALLENNILEIEVLPNRGDCHSVIGIAREVCAVFGYDFKQKKIEVKESSSPVTLLAGVEIKDFALCPRYMARVISGVTVKESPSWMQKRLIEAGMRPLNNIVDSTNYVMLEMGNPLHAFDLDKLSDKKIVVRKASDGEKFSTLDGVERILSKDILMIADGKRPVAIAGVMGGANSEVASSTKNILLESAYFDAVSINKASKYLKLRTEASIRFERGVDFDNVGVALDRAAMLIAETSGGSVAKGAIDIKKEGRKPKEIVLRIDKVRKTLGIEIPKDSVVSILKGLGFGVREVKDTLTVSVPLYRAGDVEREIDLVEEVIRIHGYDNLKSTYPHIQNSNISGDDAEKILSNEKKVREVLIASGFSEAKTYSMIGKKLFEKNTLSANDAVEITNPLIEEMTHMRTSVLPGLLEAVEHNINRQMHDIALFEIGKVFSPKEPNEKTVVAGVLTGSVLSGAVEKDKINEDLFFIKGVVNNILDVFHAEDIEIKNSTDEKLAKNKGAEVFLNGKKVGFFGAVNSKIQANNGLPKTVYVFKLDIEPLDQFKPKHKTYKRIPKFPSVRRDIAMFIPQGVTHKKIAGLIKAKGAPLVEEVKLFDKFSQQGKTSLAYSVIYRDPNKTLTDEEVNSIHQKVLDSLVNDLGVEIRG